MICQVSILSDNLRPTPDCMDWNVPSIVQFKKENSLPVYQPDREKQLGEKYLRLANESDVNPELIQKIFNLIIAEMRLLQAQEMA